MRNTWLEWVKEDIRSLRLYQENAWSRMEKVNRNVVLTKYYDTVSFIANRYSRYRKHTAVGFIRIVSTVVNSVTSFSWQKTPAICTALRNGVTCTGYTHANTHTHTHTHHCTVLQNFITGWMPAIRISRRLLYISRHSTRKVESG